MAQPDLIGIVGRDMATALRFYRLLGLEILAYMDTEPDVEVVLPGGFRIAWDSLEMIKGVDPNWVEAPWDACWGQRYAVVLDPDGNSVDLFAGQ